jgi:hypothetical protein
MGESGGGINGSHLHEKVDAKRGNVLESGADSEHKKHELILQKK